MYPVGEGFKMDRVLILDDDEDRHVAFRKKYPTAELTHVYTSKEAIKKLENESFDWVFLDHDLGGQMMVKSGDDTGYEVANWMSEHIDRLPTKGILLHSLNPVGRKNMMNVLRRVDIDVYDRPGYWHG